MILEAIIIQYLNDVLDVPVYAEEPDNKVLPYVVLEQTSTDKENLIVFAAIAFDSYADTKIDAINLNNEVISAMEGFDSVMNVSRSELNTSYNNTDTTTKRYCYSCSFDVVYIPD